MITDPTEAWVYLNAVSSRPTAALWNLVEAHGPVEAVDRIMRRHVPPRVLRHTEARAATVEPAALLAKAAEVGAQFICPQDDRWPAAKLEALNMPRFLTDTDDDTRGDALRPFGLWLRGGSLKAWTSRPCVAIVGTRSATDYGRHVADAIATTCAHNGITVISGGAFGIDAAVHRGTLTAGGVTGAVLACGINTLYPAGNRGLLEAVIQSAGIVSEYPVGTETRRYRFPDRNRIIAALADLTVVVEAGTRSGALNTARHAADCHNPVLAVPGTITRGTSAGTNTLIARGDALMVTRPDDVVEFLGLHNVDRDPAPASEGCVADATYLQEVSGRHITDRMGDHARRVYEALAVRTWRWPEEIVTDAGLAETTVLAVLGELLAGGYVVRDRGRWRRLGPKEVVQGALFDQ